ncbi:hypothetical protein HYR99_10135 [Candidatus Poribacteria bacterium]|nr:hypothetical protein [Candidatus Poribacteria bacterium]
MTTIEIQAEEELVTAFQQIAKSKLTTVEALAKEALLNYLQLQSSPSRSYSFIGIGHSGKGDISTQVDATLKRAANRHEGWSLSE